MPQKLPRRGSVYYHRRVIERLLDEEQLRSIESSYPETLEEDELPYDQWVKRRDELDRQQTAAALAEEREAKGLPLMDLFDSYVADGRKRPETMKQFRAIIRHLISYLGHDDALRVSRRDLIKWRDRLQQEVMPNGNRRSAKTINDTYLSAGRAMFKHAFDNC